MDNDEEVDGYVSLLSLYRVCRENFGWSLKTIDDTDFELLLDFIFLKDEDPNTRAINGKTFYRAKNAPSWL